MAHRDSLDAEILRGIDRGDHRGALGAIARAYRRRIGAFCLGMLSDPEDAEDAVQDTLVAAYEAMPRYRGETSVRIWLFAIARHKCLDRLRRRAVRHAEELPANHPARATDPVDVEWLRRGLVSLGRDDRAAVLLKYAAGLTFEEVSRTLGISISAAKMRTMRALERLREQMR